MLCSIVVPHRRVPLSSCGRHADVFALVPARTVVVQNLVVHLTGAGGYFDAKLSKSMEVLPFSLLLLLRD